MTEGAHWVEFLPLGGQGQEAPGHHWLLKRLRFVCAKGRAKTLYLICSGEAGIGYSLG